MWKSAFYRLAITGQSHPLLPFLLQCMRWHALAELLTAAFARDQAGTKKNSFLLINIAV